jgi:hypothetical protein
MQASLVRKLRNTTTRSLTTQKITKGGAVFVSDLEVIQENISLKAERPFKYSANFLAITFAYNPGTPQISIYRFKARNGESYHVLMYKQDAVFVREDGTLCDRVVRFSSDASSIVAYTYKTEPEDVKFTFGKERRSWGTASLRIIYVGVVSGTLQFQEVWASDGNILESKMHQFDQYAKEVSIAGFPIHVAGAGDDFAAISVDASDELIVSIDEARSLSRFLKK